MQAALRVVVGILIVAVMVALGLFTGCTVGVFTSWSRPYGGEIFERYLYGGGIIGGFLGLWLVWRYIKRKDDTY